MAEGRPNLQEERKGPSNEAGQAASGRGLRAEGAVRPAFPVDSTRTKGAKGGRQRKERGKGEMERTWILACSKVAFNLYRIACFVALLH